MTAHVIHTCFIKLNSHKIAVPDKHILESRKILYKARQALLQLLPACHTRLAKEETEKGVMDTFYFFFHFFFVVDFTLTWLCVPVCPPVCSGALTLLSVCLSF